MKLLLALSLLASANAQATGFYRLNATTALNVSKATLPTRGADERSVPFDVAPNLAYKRITDRLTLNATGSFPAGFGLWDMVTFAAPEDAKPGQYPAASENIFIPIEESQTGGVFRYNVATGQFFLLAVGKGGGDAARNLNPLTWNATNDELIRIDPATYTPFNTLLIAEETNGTFLFKALDTHKKLCQFFF
jgi:hypothetical protein